MGLLQEVFWMFMFISHLRDRIGGVDWEYSQGRVEIEALYVASVR